MSDYRRWASEEEQYIRDHWKTQSDAEMATALKRMEGAVRTKRRQLRCSPQRTWTPEEERYLEDHWGTVSIPGIAKTLERTVSAIKVRAERLGLGGVLNSGDYVTLNQLMIACNDLGLKERPVRADNHGKASVWTDADYQALADGIRHGDSYPMIGKVVGRSEKAVRGKVYFTYLTEDADKVRAMLKDGPWGYGAPEPTVRQGFNLSRTRTEVRKDLSVLDALLRKRMNDLGYDPYWQRFMCQHWDAVQGCTAGCTDCDSCTEFKRIKPQYCRMCGGEFLERREQTFCPKCRAMRKKQAQRKYAVLHARGRY